MQKLFGGVKPMTDEMIDFIANWEVESYRSKVADAGAQKKRLDGKIAIITGGAQGFGKGIADAMAAEGANIVIADMNEGGAAKAAAEYGVRGYAVAANVTDEESVKNMIDRAVLAFGGLDIFVNNAGIAKAGSLEEMTKSTLELVTSVNYTGYFLCTKICFAHNEASARYRARLHDGYHRDQLKSGLVGSNKILPMPAASSAVSDLPSHSHLSLFRTISR